MPTHKHIRPVIALVFAAGFTHSANADEIDDFLDLYFAAYEAFEIAPFLEFYADDFRFEDPAFQADYVGIENLRESYGNWVFKGAYGGNFEFDIQRHVYADGWLIVEGNFSLTFNGQPATTRFTSWYQLEDGKIQHQIDYFDYTSLNAQIPDFGTSMPSEYTGPANKGE